MADRDGSDARLRERPRAGRRGGPGGGPVRVSELLVPSLARLGLRGRAVEAQVLAAWPEAVGEAVARETHCAGLSRGRLTIESTSSALSHQLLMQKQTIIDTLNLQLGDDLVRDLRFRLLAAPPGEKAAVNPGRRGRAAR